MAMRNMVEALNLALHQAMENDPDVLVMGEDVGVDGGVGGQHGPVEFGVKCLLANLQGAELAQVVGELFHRLELGLGAGQLLAAQGSASCFR